MILLKSDIICGRGKGFNRYEGNQVFRETIKRSSSTYLGFGANRTEKSNLIQKIFEELVFSKNMRFVTHVKKTGWFVLDEREIKLKISHALRDAKTLRKRQVERTETTKGTMKKKKKKIMKNKESVLACNALPAVESTQKKTQSAFPANNGRGTKTSVPPCQSQPPCQMRIFSPKDSRTQSVASQNHDAAKTQPYPCKLEASTTYEHKQGKRDTLLDELYSSLCKGLDKSMPPEGTSSFGKSPSDAMPDVEPLPLSCNFPNLDKEEDVIAAISSLFEGEDARSSFSSDSTASAMFLYFMEEGGEDGSAERADEQLTDWVF